MKEEIKLIIDSGFVYNKLETIADKFNLKLDQLGQLNDDLEMFLYGKIASSEIIKVISENIEISEEMTKKLWGEIDTNILSSIKTKIRENVEQNSIDSNTEKPQPEIQPVQVSPPSPQPIPGQNFGPTKLEQEGQFHIEPKSPPSSSPQYNDTNLDREAILKEIEDTQHPTMIDHLLTTPINNTHKVEEKKVIEIAPEKKTVVDKKENQPPKPYTVDPYREPFA
jgi:hypothetical protein